MLKPKKFESTKQIIEEFKKRKDNDIIREIIKNSGIVQESITACIRQNDYSSAISLAKKEELTHFIKNICKRAIAYYRKKKDEHNVELYKKELEALSRLKPTDCEPLLLNNKGSCSRFSVSYENSDNYSLENPDSYNFTETQIKEEIKQNEFYNAARIAEQSGFVEWADELYEKGFKYYCENNNFQVAAKIAKRKGWKEKAKELLEKAVAQLYKSPESSNKKLATEIAEKEGLTETAILLNELIGKFHKAAELAEKARLQEKAIKNYKKAIEKYTAEEKFHIAAALADKIGLTEKAKELYIKSLDKYDQEKAEGKAFTVDFFTTINDAIKESWPKDKKTKKFIKDNDKFIEKLNFGLK